MESILNSIKKLLGITPEYTHFDRDLIIHINTVFGILHQLGVGPQNGFSIVGDTEIWNDFMEDSPRLEVAKNYIYLKVKLLFDPPTIATVAESTKRLCDEMEWRVTNM